MLQFGNTPGTLFGIATHQDTLMLRNWKWEPQVLSKLPVQLHDTIPSWMRSFISLGQIIHQNDVEEAWGPYCIIAEKDPHALLDRQDFLQQLTTLNTKSAYLDVLVEYSLDFYKKELITIFQRGPQTYKTILEKGITMLDPLLKGGSFKTEKELEQRKSLVKLNKKMNEFSEKQKLYVSK